jgi:uncharacterized protein YbjT (DUF2867 family)
MADTVLLTGATGNIGKPLVQTLLSQGRSIKVLARDTDQIPSQPGVEAVKGDLADPTSLVQAFRGVDRLFLLTPLVPDMVKLGLNGVRAAKAAGIKHVVRSSGLGAMEEGIAIARWHRAIEKELEASGMAWTFLRPNSFFQNLFFQAMAIKGQSAFYTSLGEGKISLVDTRDVAQVAARALTEPGHEGRAYDLTGPEALNGVELAAILSRVLSRTISCVVISEEASKQAMAQMNMPSVIVDGLAELDAIGRAGYAAALSPDLSKLLGRAGRSFEQFARDHRAAFE